MLPAGGRCRGGGSCASPTGPGAAGRRPGSGRSGRRARSSRRLDDLAVLVERRRAGDRAGRRRGGATFRTISADRDIRPVVDRGVGPRRNHDHRRSSGRWNGGRPVPPRFSTDEGGLGSASPARLSLLAPDGPAPGRRTTHSITPPGAEGDVSAGNINLRGLHGSQDQRNCWFCETCKGFVADFRPSPYHDSVDRASRRRPGADVPRHTSTSRDFAMRRFTLGPATDRKIVVIDVNGTNLTVLRVKPDGMTNRQTQELPSEAAARSAADRLARESLREVTPNRPPAGPGPSVRAESPRTARPRHVDEDDDGLPYDLTEEAAEAPQPMLQRLATPPAAAPPAESPPKKKKEEEEEKEESRCRRARQAGPGGGRGRRAPARLRARLYGL